MANLTAEQIRDQFGFEYNDKHASKSGGYDKKTGSRDDGAIFNVQTGEYVGSMKGFSPSVQKGGPDDPAKGIDKYKAVQDYELEHGFKSKARTDWDSANDVAGAVNNVLNKTKAEESEEAPAKDDGPIEYSPEILQAKERVQKYESDILSGATSKRIYGNNEPFLNNYQLNLEGAQFQPPSTTAASKVYEPDTFSGSDVSAYDTISDTEQAVQNFLTAQKNKVIKQKNIKPVA